MRNKVLALVSLFFFVTGGMVYPQQASTVSDAVSKISQGAGPSSIKVDEIKPAASSMRSDLNPYTLSIPEELGSIEEVFQGAPSAPLLVYIQNVHANYEAQINIKGILNHLAEKHQFALIQLEGAVAKLDPQVLQPSYLREANLKLVDFLMREGRITGADTFAVETDKPVTLHGIEDQALYTENLKMFKSVYKHQAEVDAYFKEAHRLIQDIGPKLLAPEPLDFTRKTEEFAADKIDILDYLLYMNELSEKRGLVSLKNMAEIVKYPNLVRIMRLHNLEAQLDKSGLKKEVASLKEDFKTKLPGSKEAEEILSAIEQNRKGLPPRDYFLKLTELAGEAKIEFISYPALRILAEFLIHQDEIDHRSLFTEIKAFEAYLQEKLFTKEEEKTFIELISFISLLEQYLHLEVSREKLAIYVRDRDRIKPSWIASNLDVLAKKYQIRTMDLSFPQSFAFIAGNDTGNSLAKFDSYMGEVEYFYQLVLKRDEMFIEKILANMRSNQQEKTILITGGFHKDGLTDYFRKENISYVIVNPKVDVKQGNENYLKVMLDEDAVIGTVFAGTFAVETANVGEQGPPNKVLFVIGPGVGITQAITTQTGSAFDSSRSNARFIEIARPAGVLAQVTSATGNQYSTTAKLEAASFDQTGKPQGRTFTVTTNIKTSHVSVRIDSEARANAAELKKAGIDRPPTRSSAAFTGRARLQPLAQLLEGTAAPARAELRVDISTAVAQAKRVLASLPAKITDEITFVNIKQSNFTGSESEVAGQIAEAALTITSPIVNYEPQNETDRRARETALNVANELGKIAMRFFTTSKPVFERGSSVTSRSPVFSRELIQFGDAAGLARELERFQDFLAQISRSEVRLNFENAGDFIPREVTFAAYTDLRFPKMNFKDFTIRASNLNQLASVLTYLGYRAKGQENVLEIKPGRTSNDLEAAFERSKQPVTPFEIRGDNVVGSIDSADTLAKMLEMPDSLIADLTAKVKTVSVNERGEIVITFAELPFIVYSTLHLKLLVLSIARSRGIAQNELYTFEDQLLDRWSSQDTANGLAGKQEFAQNALNQAVSFVISKSRSEAREGNKAFELLKGKWGDEAVRFEVTELIPTSASQTKLVIYVSTLTDGGNGNQSFVLNANPNDTAAMLEAFRAHLNNLVAAGDFRVPDEQFTLLEERIASVRSEARSTQPFGLRSGQEPALGLRKAEPSQRSELRLDDAELSGSRFERSSLIVGTFIPTRPEELAIPGNVIGVLSAQPLLAAQAEQLLSLERVTPAAVGEILGREGTTVGISDNVLDQAVREAGGDETLAGRINKMNQVESVSEPMIFAVVSEADSIDSLRAELLEIGLAVQGNPNAFASYYVSKSALELIKAGVPGIDQNVWSRVNVIPVTGIEQALSLLQKHLRGKLFNDYLNIFPGTAIQELRNNFHVRIVRPPQAQFGEGVLDLPGVKMLQVISAVGSAEARRDPVLAGGLLRVQLHVARFFPSTGDVNAAFLRRGLDGFVVAVEGVNAYGVPVSVFYLVKQLQQAQEFAVRIARAA